MGYRKGKDKVENRKEVLFDTDIKRLGQVLTNIRDRSAVFLGLETAARVSEMKMFTVAGISWENSTISKWDTKKKQWIEVGISPVLLRDLRQYVDSFRISGVLFPLTWSTFNRILKEACRTIGIKEHVSWHLLRRSFCSKAEDKGYTVKEVMHITGDTERTVVRYYKRVSVGDLGKKAARFYQNEEG